MSDTKRSGLLEVPEKQEIPEAQEAYDEQDEQDEELEEKKRYEDHQKTLAEIELRVEEKMTQINELKKKTVEQTELGDQTLGQIQNARSNQEYCSRWSYLNPNDHRRAEVKQLQQRRRQVMSLIIPLQEKMRQRAISASSAYGGTMPNKPLSEYSNVQTEQIMRTQILPLDNQIGKLQQEIDQETKQYERLNKIDWHEMIGHLSKEWRKNNAEVKKLEKEVEQLKKNLQIMRSVLKMEKLRVEYERYARKQGTTHYGDIFQEGTGTAYLSGTQSDPSERLEELQQLVRVCNTHRQNYLLRDERHVDEEGKTHRGYLFYTRCHKHYHPVRCNQEVWTGDIWHYDDIYSTTCECGCRHQWNMEGFDPMDIDRFNIQHTQPYGHESTDAW